MGSSIELDYSCRDKIMQHVTNIKDEPEMSLFESAFVCGLLKRFKPKKIMEIGIAGGGTTAIMLQCMKNLGMPFHIYSVDKLEMFYRGKHGEKSGFIGAQAMDFLGLGGVS